MLPLFRVNSVIEENLAYKAVIFPVCILVPSYTDRLKFAISILAQIRNKRNQKREIVAESSQSVTGLQQSNSMRSSYSVFKILKIFQSI